MDKKDKKGKESNDPSLEHQPLFPINENIEKRKKLARDQAAKLRKESTDLEAFIVVSDGSIKKASKLNLEEQELEIVKCALNPIYFIETYFTIFDQTQGDGGKIVPFKLFDFQKELIQAYEKNQLNVANKYRQAGISTCTCAYIAWYIAFKENRNVAIVADKLETARDEMMKDVVDFLDSCPKWLVPQPTKTDNKKHKHYDNNCQLRAFATSGLRGYTPTLLFWDETAWAEKGDDFWTSARPAVLNTGGKAIFVSCVTKDSFIFTEKGIKQVKDFIKTEKLGAHLIDKHNILGTHKTRKSNIIFNNGYVDTLKIKTSYNELESSENHKYWAYKDGKYDWFKASELEIGDYISIQKGMNIWGNNDDCSNFKPTEKNIKNKFKPNKITPDIAYLIGLYISEGCGIKRRNKYSGIVITCNDDISNILNKLSIPFYKKDNLHHEIGTLNVSEFFEYLGFDLSKKAPQKIIPSRLLEMSKENIIAMIQGIMDGDGWATYNNKKNKLRIGIGLSSLKLINQLRIIFNNFGILTEFQQVITPKTKKVNVESIQYRLTANGCYAKKYFKEIGFRLKRKKIIINDYDVSKLRHIGVHDNIPNGTEIINEIYDNIKFYGKLKYLNENNIKIDHIVSKKKNITSETSRKTILKLIELERKNILNEILEKYHYIINNNIVWTKIKSIEKSKNFTYDFSMSNNNEKEWNEHHMSLIYNGLITHNTPNGLDPIFYKTFNAARNNKSNFNAIELWWFNDPRYIQDKETGKLDLEWIKNKGKENETIIKDEGWSVEERIKLHNEGWEATSSWFRDQVIEYNEDMKKLSQELLCSFLGSGNNFISEEYLKRIEENEIKTPIRQEYTDNEFWIWEDPEDDVQYIQTIDVSSGHGDDYSAINIFKIEEIVIEKIINDKKKKIRTHKAIQVAEYYEKILPQNLGYLGVSYGKRYNNAYTIIDVTNGYGAITVEKFLDEGYNNIHYGEITHKPTRDKFNGYIKTIQKTLPNGNLVKVDLIPGFFIGANRASMLIEMQRCINMEDVIIRSIRLLSELKTFITVKGNRVADHKRSFHDDSIMSMSMGLFILNNNMFKLNDSIRKTKKILDAFLKLNHNEIVEKVVKPDNKNKDSRIQDFRVSRTNPYGANSWLFKK